MARCEARTFIGSQCELDDGHAGKHARAFPAGGSFYWTAESEQAVADRWEERRRKTQPGS